MEKTLADLIAEEAKNLDGFVYSSYPYSCGIDEAKIHAARYAAPQKSTITREEKKITIEIKPLKGSRKRKLLTIKLWTT